MTDFKNLCFALLILNMLWWYWKGGNLVHNLVYLIGRLTDNPELKEYEDGKSMLTINLAVQRSYKNENGLYEVDFIRCVLWNGVASHTSEYCKKGDLVGVKGKIQTRSYEDNGEKKYITEVIVDKVSFLASKRNDTEEKPDVLEEVKEEKEEKNKKE